LLGKQKISMKNKLLKTLPYLIISILVGVTAVYAGTLTPPGTASNTMYSLTDIFNLSAGTTTTLGSGTIETTPTEVIASGKTLTQVYTAITGELAKLTNGKIAKNVSAFGFIGTLYGDADASKVLDTATYAGTITTKTLSNANDTVSAGYYAATTLSAVDTDLASGNIKKNTSIFGIAGDSNVVDTSSGDAATTDIASGKKAWVDGAEVTGEASGGVDLSNMFNGSCKDAYACPNDTEFPGGNQALGGVDDSNADTYCVTHAPPVNRYETTWKTCIETNDYCDTDTNNNGVNDSGANAKDEATGLVWSFPCSGSGCVTWNTEIDTDVLTEDCPPEGEDCAYSNGIDTYYSWDNLRIDNNGKTAQLLCSSHYGWYLPHQKQLMQAYIDGAYGNLEPQGVWRWYWSATTNAGESTNAVSINLAGGLSSMDSKHWSTSLVRCVR
jgi:hypothetical protein